MSDGYQQALEAAGALVYAFEEFGDYQGSWYALVEYNNQKGVVEGNFGSCSGCDSFQSEFDYAYSDTEDTEEGYKKRLKTFGESYLKNIKTLEEAIEEASKDEWNSYDDASLDKLCWLKQLKKIEFKDKIDKLIEE